MRWEGPSSSQSQVDKGTEFHITLDLEAVSDQEADMVLPNWEVLVVDDDAQLCSSAASSLTEIGVHAECALDGPSAISMVERRHQKRRGYHVVLLDWQMPGMDGIETARALRRRVGKDIPILLISAYDWSDIAEEARAAGISGFLSKPLFKSTLFYGLSRFAEPASAKADAAPELAPDFTGRHLLLAEDSALNWEIAVICSPPMALHWTGRKTAGSVWSAFKRRRQIITMQSSWTSACPLWTAIRLPGPFGPWTVRTPGRFPSLP